MILFKSDLKTFYSFKINENTLFGNDLYKKNNFKWSLSSHHKQPVMLWEYNGNSLVIILN